MLTKPVSPERPFTRNTGPAPHPGPAHAAACFQREAGRQADPGRRTDRPGPGGLPVEPLVIRMQLKMLAAERGTSVHSLVCAGLNAVFAQHHKPEITGVSRTALYSFMSTRGLRPNYGRAVIRYCR